MPNILTPYLSGKWPNNNETGWNDPGKQSQSFINIQYKNRQWEIYCLNWEPLFPILKHCFWYNIINVWFIIFHSLASCLEKYKITLFINVLLY